ncbi:MAG: haloacid dehalogenase-like hydrolase [Pirellulales bacterium]
MPVVLILLAALAVKVSPPAQAAEPLTAIDVLLLPDETMVAHAKRDNARLRANYPEGFALDAEHHPHITLLQRYVRTKDLASVYAAVERVLNRERPAGWELTATGYYYLDFNNMGLAGIVIRPTPELRRLQQEIVDAVAPFTEPNGTAAAYVTTPQSPGVNEPTLEYVNHFVPQRNGKNFNPHVTIGVGQLDFVQKMKAVPFDDFKFKVAGAAVFHLGNFGTAAKELWQWTVPTSAALPHDPLPSWNDGATKQSIIAFVNKVTAEGSADFVSQAERIATFDNDGTLWCEMPMYVQLRFALDRIEALGPKHPEWRTTEPYKSVLDGNLRAALGGGEKAGVTLLMAGHAGVTTAEFEGIVSKWLATARHPRYNRPYTSLAYQPMLELLSHLRSQGFKTYIVSGGGVEFMRPWTSRVYDIPPEQVVGSTIKTKYALEDGEPVLMRLPEIAFIDDKDGKAIGINTFIGRRPVMAFGNSDGDYEMLRWTTAGAGPRFGLIVHHTDAEREYAYDRNSDIGRLAKALDEAPERGWTVVDMKNDWKTIFPSE